MSPDVQRRLVFVLGATLAAVGAWRFLGGSDAPASVAASTRGPGAKEAFEPPPSVGLAALDAYRPRPSEVARNPFVFGSREVVAEPVQRTGGGAPGAAQPPAPVQPAGPPPLPPIPFKFIGLVEGAAGARIAVLSDTKGLVVHGAEGTIIDGRYRILSIGADTIELAYADGRGRQTLRLSGQ